MKLAFELKKLFGRGNLSAEVCREFDRRRGYARHHAVCRAALERPIPSGPDAGWTERGYAVDRVVPGDQCDALRLRIDAASVPLHREGPSEIRRIGDSALQREVLELTLTPEIDRRLLQFFESEYVPYFCVYNVTPAGAAAQRSFRWHCDQGPSATAKLLVNLTSASETGGSTLVIDREQTRGFDRAGIVFQGQDERREDLTDLARQHGLAFEPRPIALEAGEALCFLPRHVMHRGMPPPHGARRMLSIVFLPSPVPWREAVNELDADPPAELGDLDWAQDAASLTRLLQTTPDAAGARA